MVVVTSKRSRIGRQHSSSLSKKCVLLRDILLVVLLVVALFLCVYSTYNITIPATATLLSSKSTDSTSSITGSSNSINDDENNKCWIKKAIQTKTLKLFSHRSFGNASLTTQPTCEESLLQLKRIGVNHFDVDLVLGNLVREDDASNLVHVQDKNSIVHSTQEGRQRVLIVAHPMEYKHESNYYSPCSNIDFDSFIATLKSVYGNGNGNRNKKTRDGKSSTSNAAFFLSLEPKAAWRNTPQEIDDPALTNLPSDILQIFLQAIERHELKGQCAAIVDLHSNSKSNANVNVNVNSNVNSNSSHSKEEINQEYLLLKQILLHCEHYSGVRITDPVPTSMGEYDRIMPTIEFHPKHAHNPLQQRGGDKDHNDKTAIANAIEIPRSVLDNSILWTVDDKYDLLMAAEMRPFGIVSNVPLTINAILQDPDWCGSLK